MRTSEVEEAHRMGCKRTIDKRLFAIILICSLASFGCSSPATEIKLVLDQYDQINKDYVTLMKQRHKEKGLVSFDEDLKVLQDRCKKIGKIDLSKTPTDFRPPFTRVALLNCDARGIEDLTFYDGDPKARSSQDAIRDLETISARYGHNYKHTPY